MYYSSRKATDTQGFVPVNTSIDTQDSTTQTVLTGLVPNTIYTISIAALTGAGEGTRSDKIEMTTQQAPPPDVVPIDTSVEPLGGDGTYTLGIVQSSNINGPIRCVWVIFSLTLGSGTVNSYRYQWFVYTPDLPLGLPHLLSRILQPLPGGGRSPSDRHNNTG